MKKLTILIITFFLSFTVFAQKTVKGVVKDNNGVPLMGATVLVKNTIKGTTTDFDGNYSIQLPANSNTLVFSFMGFDSKEITIGDVLTINISLKPSAEALDEVIVIGYGSVRKSDLTGSITSLKPKDAEAENARGVEDFLQGRAAGVQVSSLGNEPGAPSSIKIRGLGSLSNSTEPLYVIDGVVVDSSTEDTLDPLGSDLSAQQGIAGVNPSDIENIQILKDASATAIYGSRGSNGVILITTKKGRLGKAKFRFSTTSTVGNITNNIEVLNGAQYADFRNKASEALGQETKFYTYPNGSIAEFNTDEQYMIDNSATIPRLVDKNWSDETYRTALGSKHRLSISGGSETGNYYIAGGISKNQGVIPKSSSNSGDFVININQDLNERLKLGTKISTTFTENSASKGTEGLGDSRFNIIKQIISYAPFEDLQENFENSDIDDPESFVDGPQAWIDGYDDNSKDIRIQGSFKLDYKISDVFSYRFLFGGDYRTKERKVWYGNELKRGAEVNGEAGLATLDRFRYNIDNTLMFRKRFNKNHRINGTVGVIFDKSNIQNTASSASGFANHILRADGIQYGELYSPLTYTKESEAILSFIGRLNYTLKNKYLFTGTIRADGSSKFASNNRWGYFPSFGFAWKANEENFLQEVEWISDAKLRLGWGLTGNQRVPNYRTLTPFGNTNVPLSDGQGGILTSLQALTLANPDLTWESTSQYNAGIDFGFLDNRITANVDVYYKEVDDLLLNVSIGPSTGFGGYYANQGSITNKGLEVSLNADIIDKKFKWNVFGNIGINRNKIEKLGIPEAPFGTEMYSAYLGDRIGGGLYFKTEANIFIEGQPAGLFYGYATDGIINNADELASAPTILSGSIAPQLGDVLLVDQDGDGFIDPTDLTIIGDPNPDFTYGFGSNFEYENFSLNFFFNGVYGNEIANGSSLQYDYAVNSVKNISKDAYVNAWTPENPDATFPRFGYNYQGATTGFTDRIVEDGSFLRLSNVSLSYSIPAEKIKAFDAINITLSGQNLLLFTKYSGFDPEVSSFSFNSNKIGVDWNSFPNQKRFALGLNVSF